MKGLLSLLILSAGVGGGAYMYNACGPCGGQSECEAGDAAPQQVVISNESDANAELPPCCQEDGGAKATVVSATVGDTPAKSDDCCPSEAAQPVAATVEGACEAQYPAECEGDVCELPVEQVADACCEDEVKEACCEDEVAAVE